MMHVTTWQPTNHAEGIMQNDEHFDDPEIYEDQEEYIGEGADPDEREKAEKYVLGKEDEDEDVEHEKDVVDEARYGEESGDPGE
jgi:hypothetical protein